jgi:hypothetical protein
VSDNSIARRHAADNNPGLIRRTSIPLERAGREATNGTSKL